MGEENPVRQEERHHTGQQGRPGENEGENRSETNHPSGPNEAVPSALRRELGLLDATAIGLGAIIGAGVLVRLAQAPWRSG